MPQSEQGLKDSHDPDKWLQNRIAAHDLQLTCIHEQARDQERNDR